MSEETGYCTSCRGEGVIHTGIDESPVTECSRCDGTGYLPVAVTLPAAPAPSFAHALTHRSIEAVPAPTEQATPQQQADIDAVYDFMGIGSQARSPHTLMANLRNMNHFADLLHAVEREFFMVPGEPDEDFPDEEPQDECLLNCWGSTQAQYIEQFRAALAARQAPTELRRLSDGQVGGIARECGIECSPELLAFAGKVRAHTGGLRGQAPDSRDAALELAAAICDAQALEPECPERATYCADAIRALKGPAQ